MDIPIKYQKYMISIDSCPERISIVWRRIDDMYTYIIFLELTKDWLSFDYYQ